MTIRKSDGGVPRPRVETPKASAPRAPAAPVAKKKVDASSFKEAAKSKAVRAAQMKALDAKLKAAGIADDARARIIGRLGKLDKTAWERETKLLDGALAGPNADRALNAYDKIQTVSESSPEAAKRITPEIRDALVRGVSERRTADDVGQEGILGVKQAEEAAKALATMPQAQYDAASKALAQAGMSGAASPKADPQAEKALILKAIASRADRLKPNFIDDFVKKLGISKTTEAERAMGEITGFADDVRGTARDELIRTTTAIDLEKANTSTTNPDDMRGKGNDTRGDNDGLYQRYEDTCGPTTSQMTRAEADPIYARQLNKDGGLGNTDPNSLSGKEQKATLEKPRFFDASDNEVIPTPAQLDAYKKSGTMPPGAATVEVGKSSSRRSEQAWTQANDKLNGLKLPDFAKDACRKLMRGQDMNFMERAVANFTLGKLRTGNDGHPTAEEMGWMKSELVENSNGMRLDPALRDIAKPATHLEYDAKWVGAGGLNAAGLDDMDKRLKNGQDVPIRVSDSANSGGHFMLVSDTRGKSPDRTYLVSDPYSGRTAWVKESDMTNTNSPWLKSQFDLGWTQISHYYPEK